MYVFRLSAFEIIVSQLTKKGTCVKFILKCCPEVIAESMDANIAPLTESWLESIALKLGTFWALPERLFLINQFLEFDSTGALHTK
jgi:hypothetical protein